MKTHSILALIICVLALAIAILSALFYLLVPANVPQVPQVPRISALPEPVRPVVIEEETFTDPEGRYSFVLPQNIIASTSVTGQDVSLTFKNADLSSTRSTSSPSMWIGYRASTTHGVPEQFLGRKFGFTVSTTSVDGIVASRYMSTTSRAASVIIVVPLKDGLLQIGDTNGEFQKDSIFDQIITSINILKK